MGGQWPPSAPLLAPTGNITGPERQYPVVPKPSNTHPSILNRIVSTAELVQLDGPNMRRHGHQTETE